MDPRHAQRAGGEGEGDYAKADQITDLVSERVPAGSAKRPATASAALQPPLRHAVRAKRHEGVAKLEAKLALGARTPCPWPSPRCVVSVLLGRYVPYAALADFVPAAAVVVAAAAQGLSAQLAAPGGYAGCSYAAASAAVVSCGQRVKVVHVVQVEGTMLFA
jgi:hypothetical protein